MMSPIGTNQFKVGETYFDAVGRKWNVRQIFKVNGWTCLLLCRWDSMPLCSMIWHPATVEDGGKTATILFDEGFSTLYAEEEKE